MNYNINSKFLTDIKAIIDAKDSNRLVVFAGAGVSIDAGVPSWGKLIDSMKDELGGLEKENDYLKVAQLYYNQRGQKEYIEKVRKELRNGQIKHNELHEAIFDLNPVHILTTNFEDLLEQVIKNNSHPFSIITKDIEFPYASNEKYLVKIHGDLNETDFVLKEDDYLSYGNQRPLTEAFIKSIFSTKLVLFVGYSFSDIDLKIILQSVSNILGENKQYAYLLSPDNMPTIQREYLEKKGIHVVCYSDADYFTKKDEKEEKSNLIDQYLTSYPIDSLSDLGHKLYLLLKYIAKYDIFKESIKHKSMVEQVYYSLDRFSDLNCLPSDFIASIYPFNNSNDEIQAITNGIRLDLHSDNTELTSFLENDLIFDQNGFNFHPAYSNEWTESQYKENQNKFKKAQDILISSQIYQINGIDITKGVNSNSCNCLRCKFERLKLKEVLKDIYISSNAEIEEEDKAYYSFKVEDFEKSRDLYKRIAVRSWDSRKYFCIILQ